jgi:hypothetical protein
MTHVDTLERPIAGAEAMMDRDPMLHAAVEAHRGEWRPDLNATTNYRMDQGGGLPEVQITTTSHQMTWQTPDGLVRRHQEWLNGPYRAKAGWHATATIPDRLPETVLTVLPGRSLREVVDLPGAEAWIVDAVARVPNFHVDLVLRRA